jgi:hypothetical protein
MEGNMIRSMKKHSIICLLFFQPGIVMAQMHVKPDSMLKSIRFDTLRLTITDAEQMFMTSPLKTEAK